jgi:hypothetical protein
VSRANHPREDPERSKEAEQAELSSRERTGLASENNRPKGGTEAAIGRRGTDTQTSRTRF